LRENSPTDWLLLFLLCAAGVALGSLQNASRVGGGADLASRTVQSLVNPPSRAMASVANAMGELSNGLRNGPKMRAELADLRSREAAAEMYVERMGMLEREIETLRKLHGTPSYGKTKVAARIIGFFPTESRISISAGADKGLKPGFPVVAADGLVGVVQAVNPRTSHVLLLASPGLKIGALASRNPPPAGLLRGDSRTTLILDFMDPKAPVESGDAVVTSGFSDKIPYNIPIGRVIAVDDNPEFGVRRAYVFPNVQIGTVREVFVLL
jgi:rod shape-determining protein MreC